VQSVRWYTGGSWVKGLHSCGPQLALSLLLKAQLPLALFSLWEVPPGPPVVHPRCYHALVLALLVLLVLLCVRLTF